MNSFAGPRVGNCSVIAVSTSSSLRLKQTSTNLLGMLFNLVISYILHKEDATPDKVWIDRYLPAILPFKVEDIIRTPFDLVNPCIVGATGTRLRIFNQDIIELVAINRLTASLKVSNHWIKTSVIQILLFHKDNVFVEMQIAS